MNFESHSQVGQDLWVFATLVANGRQLNGTFLDIGACEPIKLSNTYSLEKAGWEGYLIDNDPGAIKLLKAQRTAVVIEADSTKFDFSKLLHKRFDYLSLDVDSATMETLINLIEAGITFRMATIEHDSYRFGGGARDAMRKLLTTEGYELAFADVLGADGKSPFEDWWVTPGLFP